MLKLFTLNILLLFKHIDCQYSQELLIDLTLQNEQEACWAYSSDTNIYSCCGQEVWAGKDEMGISEWNQEEFVISRMK